MTIFVIMVIAGASAVRFVGAVVHMRTKPVEMGWYATEFILLAWLLNRLT